MSDFLTNAKTEFGVSTETIYKETGFFYPYILKVINWYKKKEIPILQCNVYVRQDKKYGATDNERDKTYVYTGNQWKFHIYDIETSCLKESIIAAIEYITHYPNKEDVVFVLFPNWLLGTLKMSDFLTNAKKQLGVITISEETGFFYPYVLEVINWYEKKEIPILGGDVYIKQDRTYVPAYANWAFELNDIKTSYLKESIEMARAYILNYPDKKNVVFVLIPN